MFSIIIPLFNKSSTVIRALSSIRKQSVQEFEVIVIDDGSNDNSFSIASKWISDLPLSESKKYLILQKKNEGVSSARNFGLGIASKEFVVFLDADDFWLGNHLERLRSLINKFGDQVDVFSNASMQQIDSIIQLPSLGKYSTYSGILTYLNVSLISNGFLNSSSVCVRHKLISRNKFPHGWSNLEDTITWINITANKGFAFDCIRTVVCCVDCSELSRKFNFNNYNNFYIEFSHNTFSRWTKFLYLIKFSFIHFMYAKLTDNESFFKQWSKVIGKSIIGTFCYLVVTTFPVSFIKKFKNYRKDIK